MTETANNWFKHNVHKIGIGILAILITVLFTYNFFEGERIQMNDGLGWDGTIYAKWAQTDTIELLKSDDISDYYVNRLLPSIVVHNVTKSLGYDVSTNIGVINAFYIYNTLILLAAFFFLYKISRHLQWNAPTFLIVTAGIFFNYAVLKNMSYNPTLTDMTALSLSVITLYFWLTKRLFFYVITSLMACFVWPSFVYFFIPLLFFWQYKNPQDPLLKLEGFPKKASYTIAFALAAGTAFVTLILFFFTDFRLPSMTNQLNVKPLLITVPLYVGYLYFGLRKFTDPFWAFNALKRANWRYVLMAIIAFVFVKLIVYLISNGQAGPLEPAKYIALIAQGGMVNPLTNVVAHIGHYGPIVVLAILLWGRVSEHVRMLNPGLAAFFCLNIYLSIGTESRQFIPFIPVLAVFCGIILNKMNIDWFTAWSFTIISLILSRFWFEINVGIPWDDRFLEFPLQMLFMYSGPWMSDQMYLVFLGFSVITFIAIAGLFRPYLSKQK